MMHSKKIRVSALIAAAVGGALAGQNTSNPVTTYDNKSNSSGVNTYDRSRNAAADIQQGIIEAQRSGKNVLLEVGGDWCPWCYKLDRAFQNHPDVLSFRDAHFIAISIYYGPDDKNEQVLSRYSKILGIPHLFVLDSDGNLLCSQHALELQTAGDYDADKIRKFLTKWVPAHRTAFTR